MEIPMSEDGDSDEDSDAMKLSLFEVTLLYMVSEMSEFSLILDLYTIFDREDVFEFLDVFSGQEIKVPSKEKIQRCFRDVIIWRQAKTVEENDDMTGSDLVDMLEREGNKFDIKTVSWAREVKKKVQEVLDSIPDLESDLESVEGDDASLQDVEELFKDKLH